MAGRITAQRLIVSIRDGVATRRVDHLAAEEPLEIRVNGAAVSVTMRTPGNDFDLAVGFCLTEGVIADQAEIATVGYCCTVGLPDGADRFNTVDVRLTHDRPVDDRLRRRVYTTSSCGICGTTAIDTVHKHAPAVTDDPLRVSADLLTALPGKLRAAQPLFERTGGIHAAGLFDARGELCCVREDVGRHNAVDKVIGWAATEHRLQLHGHILLVSGRIAFEIAQKALVAGIPLVAAVSAPSSLAVSLAESSGMTLVGFLRGGAMNVYAGADRVEVS